MPIYKTLCLTLSGFIAITLLNTASADVTNNPLDHFLEGMDDIKANFKQTLLNEHGEELETSSGIVYMSRPGKFRWDYTEPYSQQITTDGNTLWIYDEDLEQVTIRDISNSIENTPAAILGGTGDFDDHFVIINIGNIEGFEWVELTPRDIENQYHSIRLGFNKKHIGMMILFDNLGQTTRIDFIDSERNTNLDDSLFVFEPPEGVDVIDGNQ